MTAALTKRQLLHRIRLARQRVQAEIADHSTSGFFARGLATEGYAGGYRECLDDIEALLTHGYPADTRHYWRLPPTTRED